MKVMAIDYGEKRVGVASTDGSGHFALPRSVFPNDESLLDKVLEFKEANEIGRVVLGESRNLDGSENPVLEKIREFKKLLEERGIEVVFHPEIYTTMEARQIQGQTDMTDASAAALILKNYLDSIYNNEDEPLAQRILRSFPHTQVPPALGGGSCYDR